MGVKISNRLTALAHMVSPGHRLADVGTDHGYIPIYLCQHQVIPSAIAMDINEGPLARAEEHIKQYGLQDRITTRRSDGLEKLGPKEADTVLIAGMGGGLIRRILSRGNDSLFTTDGVKEWILQPQSEVAQTRRFLRRSGFSIVDEEMLVEDGKYYFLMKAVPSEVFHKAPVYGIEYEGENLTLEDRFGPILLKKKHPVLCRWIERELQVSGTILDGLEKELARGGEKEALRERQKEIREKVCCLLEAQQAVSD